VTGNTSDPSSPDWSGPDQMYTQIIKELPITAGVAHHVAIRYTRDRTSDHVDFMLDGTRVARVGNVGVPLDRQDVKYTGIYPSLGPGERLRAKLDSFVIGHGTFSLLDAFPFQWGWGFGAAGPFCDPMWSSVCALSVSIPTSERLFGQGVVAHFDNFTVATHDAD